MRNVNNSIETVNAASSAIVFSGSRVQQSSLLQKKSKSWGRWWCFGCQKKNKRIRHAVLVPEVPVSSSSTNSNWVFIAPPSSPASFLQSGPPSVSCTPPPDPDLHPSVFAVGPYAHETQPVTPPVFYGSAFTTEPSTAPFTPPPESPSSPEVPFAQLLTSSASHYEFQSQQVYPGSPGGNLISPCSGTSSPYPHQGKCSIIEFHIGQPPKFLGSRLPSGALTPFDEAVAVDHRLSFELTGEDVARCLASKLIRSGLDDKESEQSQKLRSVSLGSTKEFKFDNTKEEMIDKVRSEWWATREGDNNTWSFFPSWLT